MLLGENIAAHNSSLLSDTGFDVYLLQHILESAGGSRVRKKAFRTLLSLSVISPRGGEL